MEKLIAPKSNPKILAVTDSGSIRIFARFAKPHIYWVGFTFGWVVFLSPSTTICPNSEAGELTPLDIGTIYVTIIHG
jgi:hypothetical protein